jgi:hypothetical protein
MTGSRESRPARAIAEAKTSIAPDIIIVASIHKNPLLRPNDSRSNGRRARNSAPRLVPSIQASDQVSRACQRAVGVVRIAITKPQNPAKVTATCAMVISKDSCGTTEYPRRLTRPSSATPAKSVHGCKFNIGSHRNQGNNWAGVGCSALVRPGAYKTADERV